MLLKHLQSEPFLDGLRFAEGPRWHDGWLWFSDIERDCVLRTRIGGSPEIVAKLPSPSGLGFLPDGSLLVTSMKNCIVYRVGSDGRTQLHADLSAYGFIINDMVVTQDGRAYVDAYRAVPPIELPTTPDGSPCALSADINRHYLNGLGTSPSLDGRIIAVEPDGKHHVAAADLNYPNGLVTTPDGQTLIASISHEGKLLAFDIGADGSLTNLRVWADLPGRHPDGICIDSEGGVWVACLAISAFQRILEGGLITHHVATPGRWAVAPALGGDDSRTLFVISMEPIDWPDHRSWIERVRVEVPGVPGSARANATPS